MDLSKSYEFFQPEKDKARIHIVGCGSVGSTVAENLARCGVTKITLYDFDKVEPHNIANQMFDQNDVGEAGRMAGEINVWIYLPVCGQYRTEKRNR